MEPVLRPFAIIIFCFGCGPEATEGVRIVGSDGAWLRSSGPIVCEEPSLRGEARFDRWQAPVPANSSIWLWAGGVVAADFNGDDRIDVLSPTEPRLRTYEQTPAGTFREIEGWPARLPMATGGSVADYDGDGDLDLYVTRYAAENVLLRNDGGGQFVDVTDQAGVGAGRYRSMSSAWSDLDRDGDLDLVVGNYGWFDETGAVETDLFEPGHPSFLYMNRGDGTFEDQSDTLPASVHDGFTYVAGVHDLDGDGWPDLYMVNDFGVAYPNRLLWNRSGEEGAESIFVEDQGAAGLDLAMTGMGLGVADLNGDGWLDMLIPEWNKIRLLLSSQPLGMWVDHSLDRGLDNDRDRDQVVGWGASFADMDNDGDLDAPVAYGRVRYTNERWENPDAQPDAMFVQQPDGSFLDQAAEWGVADGGVGRGFLVVDLNDDGWLDLVKRDLAGPDVFYHARCGEASWLRVRLRGEGANTAAVGALVKVEDKGQAWTRTVTAGGQNYGSSGPPEVHFGLGAIKRVDHLTIFWPNGDEDVFEKVDTKQILTVRQRGAQSW